MENKILNLSELLIGDKAKIIGYSFISKEYRKRLLSLGLTKGITVEIVRVAPLGDPYEIKLRGFSLVLRKNEAETILVEKLF